MYTIVTYIVKGNGNRNENGIKLKKYEESDEAFENDSDYEFDGFVVGDSEPIEKFQDDETIDDEDMKKRACLFAGNYMDSMLEIFGDEYDTEEEEDEDFSANQDSSDEDSELDKSQSSDYDEDDDDVMTEDEAEQINTDEDEAVQTNTDE